MRAPVAEPSKATKDPRIENHPFVIKLSSHGSLDAGDLKALSRVLNRRLTVKKGRDIIVQGYQYKGLDIVESGFAIRYTLLHKGGRQIINVLLPGDIVGFPASFFDHSIFSVMAATEMSLHRISFDSFVELCKERPNIAIAFIWFSARESALYGHHIVDAGRRKPLERVAHFILEMHFRLKAVGWASENAFELPLSLSIGQRCRSSQSLILRTSRVRHLSNPKRSTQHALSGFALWAARAKQPRLAGPDL